MEKIGDLITQRRIGIFPLSKDFLKDMPIEFAKHFFTRFFIIDIVSGELELEYIMVSSELPQLNENERVPRVYSIDVNKTIDGKYYIDIEENKDYKLNVYNY